MRSRANGSGHMNDSSEPRNGRQLRKQDNDGDGSSDEDGNNDTASEFNDRSRSRSPSSSSARKERRSGSNKTSLASGLQRSNSLRLTCDSFKKRKT